MNTRMATAIVLTAAAAASAAACGLAAAQDAGGTTSHLSGQEQHELVLTPDQRRAIYRAVSKDTSKSSPRQFPTVVGAEVPPMIELYTLPDDVMADNPAAKYYQYTLVRDQVVLVDPTRMRIIAVIGPQQ